MRRSSYLKAYPCPECKKTGYIPGNRGRHYVGLCFCSAACMAASRVRDALRLAAEELARKSANRALLEKADLGLGAMVSNGGRLTAPQAKRFMDFILRQDVITDEPVP